MYRDRRKRTEQIADTTLPEEGIPQAVSEAHLDFVLHMLSNIYASEGSVGLSESMWTTLFVDYARLSGMQVTKDMLMQRIAERELSDKKGTFFTDIRDMVLEMRTGLMSDRRLKLIEAQGG